MNGTLESKLSTETRWKGLYRIGGVLFIVIAVVWSIVSRFSSILYNSGQPSDALGYLQLFSQKQAIAASDWSLWIFADVLLIPASIAIYFALRRNNKNLALAGTILTLLFCVYDIFGSELISLRLVGLAHDFADTISDILRAPIIASATSIVSALPLMTFFSYLIGSVGMLLWSIVMLKSFFRQGTGIFGIVANFLAIVAAIYPVIPNAPMVLGIIFVYCLPLAAIWLIVVGIQLFRHSRRLTATAGNLSAASI